MHIRDGKTRKLASVSGIRPRTKLTEADAAVRSGLREMLEHPRCEVLPLAGIVDEVAERVPRHAKLTVTASPSRGMEATLQTAEELSRLGYTVVPHLSARLVSDEVELKEIIDRLEGLGIGEVFVVGGDSGRAAGEYTDALRLLVAMAGLDHPFTEVGIAGYPESHPTISDDVAIQAMWDKRGYATYVVSQMCFDGAAVLGWANRLRQRGITLPIDVGLPGPASVSTLMRTSRRIGVGESARFLSSNGTGLLRLGRPGRYTPDRLLDGLAPHVGPAETGALLRGLHLYTFNDVSSVEQWRQTRLTATADLPSRAAKKLRRSDHVVAQ